MSGPGPLPPTPPVPPAPPAPPAGTHTEHEDDPWTINVGDHAQRTDSPEYVASRKQMVGIVQSVAGWVYGPPPYQDHHGGGLWLKDDQGWFLVRNVTGMEWSSQFCADPAKVDALRLNARRLYAAFPEAVKELGIQALLDTPITDAAGVANWTDSICNASVPLPADAHTGVLPKGAGYHHYPTPIVDIEMFKHDDYVLYVTDAQGQPAAVVPVAPRGSGDAHVEVVYATPNTPLAMEHDAAHDAGERLIVSPESLLAKQAFIHQS